MLTHLGRYNRFCCPLDRWTSVDMLVTVWTWYLLEVSQRLCYAMLLGWLCLLLPKSFTASSIQTLQYKAKFLIYWSQNGPKAINMTSAPLKVTYSLLHILHLCNTTPTWILLTPKYETEEVLCYLRRLFRLTLLLFFTLHRNYKAVYWICYTKSF